MPHCYMMLKSSDKVNLFKFKLLLKNVGFFNDFNAWQSLNFQKTCAHFLPLPYFSSNSITTVGEIKSLYFLLLTYKTNLFLSPISLSRFTTPKYRFMDIREKKPTLAEFNFDLDVQRAPLPSLAKAKVPINLDVNQINFKYHIYLKFARSYLFRKLQPYEKLLSILVKKVSIKHFMHNTFCFYRKSGFSFTNVVNFWNTAFFLLNQSGSINYCLTHILPNLNVLLVPFFFARSKFLNSNKPTGLIMFTKSRYASLSGADRQIAKSGILAIVRHLGSYYPFSTREITFPGTSKKIFRKRIGKASYFFFNPKKMLLRRDQKEFRSFLFSNSRNSPVISGRYLRRALNSLKQRFFLPYYPQIAFEKLCLRK